MRRVSLQHSEVFYQRQLAMREAHRQETTVPVGQLAQLPGNFADGIVARMTWPTFICTLDKELSGNY